MTIAVAINDLAEAKSNPQLPRDDGVHGRFAGAVTVEGGPMIVNGDAIGVLAQPVGLLEPHARHHACLDGGPISTGRPQ